MEPYPSLHTRRLNSRTAMFYVATLVTPAMCMRLTNVGSQYLAANLDSNGQPLDGAKTYRMVLIRTFLSWELVVEIEGRWPWLKAG